MSTMVTLRQGEATHHSESVLGMWWLGRMQKMREERKSDAAHLYRSAGTIIYRWRGTVDQSAYAAPSWVALDK